MQDTRQRPPAPWIVLVVLVGASPLSPTFFIRDALAQQVVADGISRTASGTIDTGIAVSTTGYALFGLNAGTIQGLDSMTLLTGGQFADAVHAESGAAISLFDGTRINTLGADAFGLLSRNAGSRITGTNLRISTAGEAAHGVRVFQDGVAEIFGGTVTTSGNRAFGLYSTTGAALSATGTTIQTAGSGAHGASAISGPITLRNVDITTKGDSALGARVDNAGTLTLDGGSIDTAGASSFGVAAVVDSSLTATGVKITTTGTSGVGATAQFGSTTILNGGTITTSGARAYGIFSVAVSGTTGSALSATGVAITTSGENAHGANVRGASSLAIVDSTILTHGAGAAALSSSLLDAGPSTAAISGSRLASDQAAGIAVTGTTLNASLTNSSVSGRSAAFSALDGATLNLDALASVLTGAAITDNASVSNLTLTGGSDWTITGDSRVTTLTRDASPIVFSAPGDARNPVPGYKTLSVARDYRASGAATITLNTQLNAGGPLSNQFTDRVLVGGTVTGGTLLNVNLTGGGAFTSTNVPGPSDGISLVQVAGASSPGAFTLAQGYVTGGTPYQYHLYAYGPGSASGAADAGQSLVGNAGDHWDYRLQSVFVTPDGPLTPNPEPVPVPAPEPPLPPDARPEVAPQVPSYLSAPRALFQAGLLDIDSLHRRLGDIRQYQQAGGAPVAEGFVRVYGSRMDYTSNLGFKDFGYDFQADYDAAQFGANYMPVNNDDGTLRIGLAGTFGRLSYEPSAVDGAGKARLDTQTISGIVTWQARSGWYVDTILSGGTFDGHVSTSERGRTSSMKGTSLAASVETGKPFALPWWSLNLEPQVQLAWQHLDFDRTTDVDGIDVNIGNHDQGFARVGVKLNRPFEDAAGARITPYLKANLLQGFGGSSPVVLSGVAFDTGKAGSALQLGGGVTGSLNKHFSLYGDVVWQTDVGGNGGFRGWAFNTALRYTF